MSFAILYAQKGHLCYLKIKSFSWFSIFIQFDPFKKCSWVMFSHFWQKSDPKRIATSKLKILRHFPKFWPLITFMWQKVTRDLGGYLEVSQTQSILFLNYISIWYGCFARRVEQGQKIENFTFDSTSDRVWLCYIITDVTDIICNRFGKPDSQKSGLFLHSSEHGIPVLRNL